MKFYVLCFDHYNYFFPFFSVVNPGPETYLLGQAIRWLPKDIWGDTQLQGCLPTAPHISLGVCQQASDKAGCQSPHCSAEGCSSSWARGHWECKWAATTSCSTSAAGTAGQRWTTRDGWHRFGQSLDTLLAAEPGSSSCCQCQCQSPCFVPAAGAHLQRLDAAGLRAVHAAVDSPVSEQNQKAKGTHLIQQLIHWYQKRANQITQSSIANTFYFSQKEKHLYLVTLKRYFIIQVRSKCCFSIFKVVSWLFIIFLLFWLSGVLKL